MKQANLSVITTTPSASLETILKCQSAAVERGLPAGLILIVNEDGLFEGVVTDGDIRRALLNDIGQVQALTARAMMTPDPISFPDHYSYQQILAEIPKKLEKHGRRSRKFLGKIVLVNEAGEPTRVLDYHQLWEQRVASHRHIAVIGLGYVGLTLGLELAREGFQVTGVDVNEERIGQLNSGISYVHELGLPELLVDQLDKNFRAQTTIPEDGDVFIISVGTPVEKRDGEDIPRPHFSQLTNAAAMVAEQLKPGGLVILRSTVSVGCTRNVVVPLLEEATGLVAGKDFHISFAPERTVEGNALSELRKLPQVIGGINRDSVEATAALFRDLTSTIVRVDSLESAEMVKLINNTFRDLIFSYANQLSQLASHFNLDVVEVIRAANQGYPRDRVPLPSPGVGGPCLTKDPYIMHEVCERAGLENTLFLQGRLINESMCGSVADDLIAKLESQGHSPSTTTVLACGLAFKGEPETGDLRSSTGMEIAQLLVARGWRVLGHDPVATPGDIAEFGLEPVEDLDKALPKAQALLLLNNHRAYRKLDIASTVRLMPDEPIIYDSWHLFKPSVILDSRPCTYMGLGFTRSSLTKTGES